MDKTLIPYQVSMELVYNQTYWIVLEMVAEAIAHYNLTAPQMEA
jgi:hypothetical protein